MSEVKKSKRFAYKLTAILKVREIRERQQKDKFAEAEKKFQEELRKEQDLKNLLVAKYSELRELMTSGEIGDVNEITRRKIHLDMVKEKVVAQAKIREESETAKEAEREKLVQTVKDKKIIEKDKEKKRDAWKKVMDKEAGKFLDDISGVGYSKKKRKKLEEELDDK